MPRPGRAREILEYVPFRAALELLRVAPEPLARGTGIALGRAAHRLLARRRRVAVTNLSRVLGDRLSPDQIDELARRSFESLGLLVSDFARLPRRDRAWVERSVTYEGWDHYQSARARGRGVLYLAAHFGSWELIPYAQALLGYPMAFIVRPADNRRIEAAIQARRARPGNHVIAKHDALRECFRRLKQGETVGILIDQHVPPGSGVPTSFLGQETFTTGALAALALRTGAPVLPSFALREPGGRHRIILGPEVAVTRSGDRSKDLVETTRSFVRVVESFILARPELWLWSHRRFRDPAASAGAPAPAQLG